MTTTSSPSTCGWQCGDPAPGHRHYAVLCRELTGKLIGRLTPEGGATNRTIHAAMLSKTRAEQIAADINAAGSFRATTIRA